MHVYVDDGWRGIRRLGVCAGRGDHERRENNEGTHDDFGEGTERPEGTDQSWRWEQAVGDRGWGIAGAPEWNDRSRPGIIPANPNQHMPGGRLDSGVADGAP